MQLSQLWPFVSRTGRIGNFTIRDYAGSFHGAEFLFFCKICVHPAPEEISYYDWQVKIDIMRNDRLLLLNISIELREHRMQ